MNKVEAYLKQMEQARAGLLAAAEAVPEELWKQAPAEGCWSAAEVLTHLWQVETKITEGAQKMLSVRPRPRTLRQRLHLPIWLAGKRLVKVKSPIPMEPALQRPKAESIARLGESRDAFLTVVRANQERELRHYWWKHPLFGPLDFYEWMRVMAYHEQRHTAQLQEIVRTFQK